MSDELSTEARTPLEVLRRAKAVAMGDHVKVLTKDFLAITAACYLNAAEGDFDRAIALAELAEEKA